MSTPTLNPVATLPAQIEAELPIWVVAEGEAASSALPTLFDEFIAGWNLAQLYGESALSPATLPEELATLLVLLHAEDGRNGRIDDIHAQDLAGVLDCSRETVAALLRTFQRQGLIELGHGWIRLVDVAALRELGELPVGYEGLG